jgi:DeoR family fructose operon transcriptional repressor
MAEIKKEPLFAEERKLKIIELLNENTKLLVPELCEYFGVSSATIRNDLRDLEGNGLLKRTHGGAIKNTKAGFELDTHQKGIKNLAQKQAIARFAAETVDDGDTIAIDTGTTALEFTKQLTSRQGLTVVVNDIKIASYLEEYTEINTILIGGVIRRKYNCTVGYPATNALKGLSVDKVFMATNGLSLDKGLTTPDMSQAEVKKAMLNIASEVIVICDSSKIGNTAFVQVAPISRVDCIITDSGIDERDIEELQALGVIVQIAEV